MNAYVSKEELALLPANRISYPEHYADARDRRPSRPGMVARLNAWLQRRSAIAELARLTDRELADIGISRTEIPHVFEPAFVARQR